MPLDGNGIWQYTEGEAASLASTMWNRLALSVSTKVAALAASIATPPVTTTSITPTGGLWTVLSNVLKKVGGRWQLSFRATNLNTGAFTAGWTTVGNVAAGNRPAATIRTAGAIYIAGTTSPVPIACACEVDATTGNVRFYITATTASQTAGTFELGLLMIWEA